MTRTEWLAGLKAGDEVAIGNAFLTIAKRTPKRFALSDDRRANENGIVIQPHKPYRQALWMEDATARRRALLCDRISSIHSGPSPIKLWRLTDDQLRRIVAILDEPSTPAKEGK